MAIIEHCPVKYFSDHVIIVINGEKLTRAEVISRLEKSGIDLLPSPTVALLTAKFTAPKISA